MEIKVINLVHQDDGSWTWRLEGDGVDNFGYDRRNDGVYYTNSSGEGVFFQSDRDGSTRQIIGTCQFSACETASGMRRKLNRMYND